MIFLGDGEFDGCNLLADIAAAGWHFVCRTAKNVLLAQADWPEETFSLSQLDLQPGDCVELADLLFTAQVTAQGFGPVLLGAVWEKGQSEPLLLVSNLDFFEDARFWYKRRFGIETFFSDQKSRGFYLCHSHLSQPERLSRLLIATCLAYYWMVCVPGLLLDGLLGSRSGAARLASPHSPRQTVRCQTVRSEPVPTWPALVGALPQ